jgi:type IV pilus assembly protein PilQ
MRVAISVSIGLAVGVLALPAQALQAPVAARTVLADLRQETGDASTRLVIVGSAQPSFTHHSPDPLTLVVDIADADSSRLPARLEVATREIESLRVSSLARGDGRTTARVEVRLAALAPFTVQEAGNDLVITVSRPTTGNAMEPVSPKALAPAPPARTLVPPPSMDPPSSDSAPKATRISGLTMLSGGRVGYHVDGNGTLRPETFFLKNPNRLVVDFPDVTTVRGPELPPATGVVKAIRLAQFSAAPPRVARLVLEVERSTPYNLVPDATGVSIILGEGSPAAPAVLGAPAKVEEPVAPIPEPATPVVHAEPAPLAEPEMAGPNEEQAPAMTTPATTTAAPMLRPRMNAEPIAQAPAGETGMAQASTEPSTFTGHPISLDFKDGDLIDLFRLMSEISGLNIIVNPGISGKVSLSVKEVPWDQALDLILKTQGLGYSVDGNVVRIAKLADLQREEQEIRNLKKEKELSGAQVSYQGRLSYLDTDQVKGVVEKTVLSDKGTFIALGAGNVFIVTDLPDRVEAAKRLIEDLDRPSAQVEIEARIVVTTRNFARQIGVQWGFLNQQVPQYGNTTDLAFPNSIILNGQGVQSTGGIRPGENDLTMNAGINSNNERGYLVNLPAAGVNTGIGISMGNILGSFNLDAALTAAENSGRARIISTPRITTQNKVPATIKQGVQIPYQTVSNGTVTVAFKDAGLSMDVTPTITDAGTVLMQVVVDNSSPDFGRVVGTGAAAVPPINTQSASTSVLVKDGATTVIGGIYQGQETSAKQSTPFLSQIPLLGLLFKNNSTQSTNNELLIFITPRIVR